MSVQPRATNVEPAPLGPPRTSPRKEAGAYFTPAAVAASLVRWAVRSPCDRLLDPSCGDGAVLSHHPGGTGVERDGASAAAARERVAGGDVHVGDFFAWAERTTDRFDCAAGNPPFIRYQQFGGVTRETALRLCRAAGVSFPGLASSWAPFLVATACLLKPGGRMAFVVPAEIGHAPYATPLVEFLAARFAAVHVVAVREKIFPATSEDCWLLYADGYGGTAGELRLSAVDRFVGGASPPSGFEQIPLGTWRDAWGRRLRPFLMRPDARVACGRSASATVSGYGSSCSTTSRHFGYDAAATVRTKKPGGSIRACHRGSTPVPSSTIGCAEPG